MIRDLFRLALRNIGHRRIRSWLTVIGILIGTAAVVALISIGQGLQRTITDQVERIMGYNTLLITSSRGQGFGQRIRVDLAELRAIPGVRAAVGVRTETGYVEGPDGKGFLSVVGYEPAMDEFAGELNLTITAGDRPAGRDQVMIGARTAQVLGAQIGTTVRIEDRPFQVVGILARQAAQGGGFTPVGVPINDALFIAYDEMKALFPGQELVQYAIVKLRDGAQTETVKEEIRASLRNAGERNASVIDFEDLTARIRTMLSGVQAFLAGIAGISILVGGIGVMNTMYTAVLERTREIGVMKAVGAKGYHVLLLFLFESGLMGLGGGLLGLLIGLGAAWAALAIVGRLFQVPSTLSPALTPALVFGALLFSFAVGAISGVLPARRAAQLPPVEALRYE